MEDNFSLLTSHFSLLIAGTSSGSGKTTVSMGLMAALIRRGYKVAPFKVGPDFIDPGHHTQITGVVSRNLDGWMLSEKYNREHFYKYSANSDIAVAEGVMGLFDGYNGKTEAGSTAQMAKWLGLPVLLVVNARSMARSAAALVQGFERFDDDLKFIGVVFNNIGSERHLAYLRDALEDTVHMPCLGGILRDSGLGIPERHLGLVTREENPLSPDYLNQLADHIEQGIDIDSVLDSCRMTGNTRSEQFVTGNLQQTDKVKIGVARDKAFCFYYQDNLDMLTAAGAELVFFSPIKDAKLPENLNGLYFGGGYPELFAEALSENRSMCSEVMKMSQAGMPIYGECGGFMYLCSGIIDIKGSGFPMAGCFPFTCIMQDKLRALGYREITLMQKTLLGDPGEIFRGHEFHYSEMDNDFGNVQTVYEASDREGVEKKVQGYQVNQTLGSYVHLHFGNNPNAAENFVRCCRDFCF
ncbi:MAG: cobyrinate a,c-diamide synthase [Desulfobacterales bacterium]|nr:cobyrinate a,c-diamide synthase [Desulfobacterales bacterium]